jgi:hypothetical protein
MTYTGSGTQMPRQRGNAPGLTPKGVPSMYLDHTRGWR